jgi:lysophospholipase L1-like esterase
LEKQDNESPSRRPDFLKEWHIIALKSEFVRRLLLIVASFLFVLLLFEIPALIQAVDYRTIIGPTHAWWAPNITDPELLHVHRPRAHQSGTAMGGDISTVFQIPPSDLTQFHWDVTYDHNGFRNETDLKSADIVVIGDSFVEGLTVTDAELATSRLAQSQGKVVANLGQSTYGPLEELVVLKRYGLPLQPRTVVWLFFEGNDLTDVTHYHRAMENPPTFWRSYWARSFTRSAVNEVRGLFAAHAEKPPGVSRSGVLQTSTGNNVTLYFFNTPPLTQENLSALDETAATIETAHKLCAAQGARLIFVYVPTKFRVFHSFCRFPQESKCRDWVVSDLPDRLQKALGSVAPEVGYLDLTPALIDAVKAGKLPYYPDDEHWSPEGHKVAAEAINDYLISAQKHSSPN